MLCIMAGIAHKNSYAATQLCLAGFAGATHFAPCSLLCFRIQRYAWSSVVHVMRQSTEWLYSRFFYVKVDYGS